MKRVFIKNARLLSQGVELRPTTISVENGRIVSLGDAEPQAGAEVLDLGGKYLSPGFTDIQLNGGIRKFFSQTPDAETLAEMTEGCLKHATPYYQPTLVTALPETIFEAIEAVREAMKTDPHILGMHLEGPFLNPVRRGAHTLEYIRIPDDELLDKLIEKGKGVISLITVAPEQFTDAQIKKLIASGIQVSAGHSEICYDGAKDAFDKGIRIVTHLYNAMSAFEPRKPGLVGAALDDDRVYGPIILDGAHCHPAQARVAYRAKGERLILITDAAVLGREMDELDFEGFHAKLTPDGFYYNRDGKLAGSAIDMPEAIKNAMSYLNITLAEAVAMATDRPAKAVGRDKQIGQLTVGYPAFFSVFTDEVIDAKSLCFYPEK